MKQIVVGNECNGCGLCVMNCPYLQENIEGNAEPIPGKAVREEDVIAIQEIIANCPTGALGIIEIQTTNKTGREGVLEIIYKLKKQCDTFAIDRYSEDYYIDPSVFRFNIKEYQVNIPTTYYFESQKYPSESAAKSAARSEMRHLCYSEEASLPLILQVLKEYQMKVLKPFFACADDEESLYTSYNKKIQMMLANAYAEINSILGEDHKIPEKWKNIAVYPDKLDVEPFKEFLEYNRTGLTIFSDMKNETYYRLDDYVDMYMEFEDTDQWVGSTIFGGDKYKKIWRVYRFNAATREFASDLLSKIEDYMLGVEEECLNNYANQLMENYEQKIKQKLSAKVHELEELLK